MSLQGIQGRLAVAGQTLQNIGRDLASHLHDMLVSAGQALKQLGGIIAQPFLAFGRALSTRDVEAQTPPERRNSSTAPNVQSRESEIESLLQGMEEIDAEFDSLDLNEFDVPPQPRDTLDFDFDQQVSGGGRQKIEFDDISQTPQNGVLQYGEENISQTPQNGVLFYGVEDIAQTPQSGVLSAGVHDIGQVPQHGFLEGTVSLPRPQQGKMDPFNHRLEQLKGKGMTSGQEAVTGSGLVPEHVEKFKSVAKETNTILMFRPVNQMSTGLLQEGTAAKGLNVHGKSSDWGPMAGYIAKDQNLSKKHNSLEDVNKGIKDNQHSLEHDSERVGVSQLSLSPNRLEYLLDKQLMRPCDEHGNLLQSPPGQGPMYFLNRAAGPNEISEPNANYMFKLEPSDQGFTVSYKSLEGRTPLAGDPVKDWTPLEVMGGKSGKDSAPIPLTADYDMFAMLPKVGDGTLIGKELASEMKLDTPPMSPRMKELTDQLGSARERLTQARESGDQDQIKSIRREMVGLGLKIAVQKRSEAQNSFVGIVNEARTKLLGQEQRRELDPELGRLTQWQRDIRTKLNDSVKGEGGYTGGDLIKHGTEMDNTQFSEKDDKVFVIMPNGETFMTQSWEQTQAFMWAAKQDDFLTYTNRSYLKVGERSTQTTFYPGQKEQGENAIKFNGKPLSFDMRSAAIKLGLEDPG